jgi:hypothetical protein
VLHKFSRDHAASIVGLFLVANERTRTPEQFYQVSLYESSFLSPRKLLSLQYAAACTFLTTTKISAITMPRHSHNLLFTPWRRHFAPEKRHEKQAFRTCSSFVFLSFPPCGSRGKKKPAGTFATSWDQKSGGGWKG